MPQDGVTPEEFFPYGFRHTNKAKWLTSKSGACDPAMGDTRERLVPQRTATGWFRGTMAAPGAPIVFALQAVQLFTNGPTDQATAAGGGATELLRSDTNAQSGSNGGGVARANAMFVATGLWFQFLEPYTVLANAPAAGTTRTASTFLRSPLSPYDKIMLQMLGPVINPRLQNGKDAACEFDLLALDVWPQSSGMAAQSIGFGGIGASFLQLAVPEVSGGSGTGAELQVSLRQERIISIDSDGANATPGNAVDVIVPVRAIVVGFPVCATVGAAEIDYMKLARTMNAIQKTELGGSYDEAQLHKAMAELKAGRVY